MRNDDYCPDFVKSLNRSEIRRFDSYRRETPEDGADLSYGDLRPLTSGTAISPSDYLVPSYFGGSDYSGGSVTKSNHRVFMSEHSDDPGVHAVHGDYGTYAVAIRLDALTEEQWEKICAVADYPILSDDDHSALEMDEQDEAWESWARDDFKRALVKRADDEDRDDCEAATDKLTDGEIFEIFREASDRSNTYWEDQNGAGQWINVERVAAAVTIVRAEDSGAIGFEYEVWRSGGKSPFVLWPGQASE